MEESELSEGQDEAIGEGNGVADAARADLPIHERMAVIEREWREMRVEWLSMYDQFRSLYGRISRRQQREDKGKPEAERPINPAAAALLGRGS